VSKNTIFVASALHLLKKISEKYHRQVFIPVSFTSFVVPVKFILSLIEKRKKWLRREMMTPLLQIWLQTPNLPGFLNSNK